MAESGAGIRGNYARGLVTQETILAATSELLLERGFHGTSIALVAERCELTPSGVQHHFSTKEQLLMAAMDRVFRDTIEWFRVQIGHDRNILDVVVELVERQTTTAKHDARLMSALAGASLDPAHPAHRWYRDRYGILRSSLEIRARIDQARGNIRPDVHPKFAAAELLATVEGLILQSLFDPDAFDPVLIATDYVRRLRPAVPSQRDLHPSVMDDEA